MILSLKCILCICLFNIYTFSQILQIFYILKKKENSIQFIKYILYNGHLFITDTILRSRLTFCPGNDFPIAHTSKNESNKPIFVRSYLILDNVLKLFFYVCYFISNNSRYGLFRAMKIKLLFIVCRKNNIQYICCCLWNIPFPQNIFSITIWGWFIP